MEFLNVFLESKFYWNQWDLLLFIMCLWLWWQPGMGKYYIFACEYSRGVFLANDVMVLFYCVVVTFLNWSYNTQFYIRIKCLINLCILVEHKHSFTVSFFEKCNPCVWGEKLIFSFKYLNRRLETSIANGFFGALGVLHNKQRCQLYQFCFKWLSGPEIQIIIVTDYYNEFSGNSSKIVLSYILRNCVIKLTFWSSSICAWGCMVTCMTDY